MDDSAVMALAAEVMPLWRTGRQVPPFTSTHPDLDMPTAYRVAAEVRRRREAAGERAVGRKVGYTNRAVQAAFGGDGPAWGWMYDSTVLDADDPRASAVLGDLAEPKIEPEIVLGLSSPPQPGMTDAELMACVEWVAHGFEIVHSPFPGWRYRPADTVLTFGHHGALLLGPRREVAGDRARWQHDLHTFHVTLSRDGTPVDEGVATNVLGGPLEVLRALTDLAARDGANPPLAAGEMVSTGTLTFAHDVAPRERWSTTLHGIDLPGLDLRFR
jgi:2-oxo-3-hexenedioate decarboxylase